uniref:Uncharacterized protein n=1 Tax=Oryza nivara TaxID=4536 RepID=A0A0E0I6R8_ORYNI
MSSGNALRRNQVWYVRSAHKMAPDTNEERSAHHRQNHTNEASNPPADCSRHQRRSVMEVFAAAPPCPSVFELAAVEVAAVCVGRGAAARSAAASAVSGTLQTDFHADQSPPMPSSPYFTAGTLEDVTKLSAAELKRKRAREWIVPMDMKRDQRFSYKNTFSQQIGPQVRASFYGQFGGDALTPTRSTESYGHGANSVRPPAGGVINSQVIDSDPSRIFGSAICRQLGIDGDDSIDIQSTATSRRRTRSVSTVRPIGKPEATTTQSIGSLKSYGHGNKRPWRHPYTTSF